MNTVTAGKGLLGVTMPGCVQAYSSQEQEQGKQDQEDRHQKIRRISRGDVIAVSGGAAHWWANDNDEEDTFNDFNHIANQLDQRLWVIQYQLYAYVYIYNC